MEHEATPALCPVCHQPVLATYYFCPNCGNKLHATPLSTSIGAQIGLYAFSIILPLICFLFVTRWQGFKYFRSKDKDTKTIGAIAIGLLVLSTIITVYLAYTWTQNAIQSPVNSINANFNY